MHGMVQQQQQQKNPSAKVKRKIGVNKQKLTITFQLRSFTWHITAVCVAVSHPFALHVRILNWRNFILIIRFKENANEK